MNHQESRCNGYIGEMGGSFSAIDGRLTDVLPFPWPVVQVAPGEFYTVREVEENGWCLPARVPAKIPAVPDHPASPGTQTGPVSSLKSVRSSLKRPAPSSPVQHVNKRVATSQTSTGTVPLDGPNQVYSPLNPSIGFSTSLASTSNGAVTKMTNISEVAQCPNFWAMPVHALYEWRRHVNILDRTILGYYEQALDEAEKDLDRAASEPDVLDTSIVTPSGRPSAPRSGRKRSVKDETPAPGGSVTKLITEKEQESFYHKPTLYNTNFRIIRKALDLFKLNHQPITLELENICLDQYYLSL
ncbi:uncharacterized protein MELLADRAFT_103001 [Melampsora larici-populina 98AG31]|uniref:Uncharacterized protein n=1 Tax=Melampsora larici-populina (strain 98AG31 / pathotype 3-4-7) TaxID=747676 RepID=F4RA84_MELLP|nr:uncharacterized protein MELLADRAFT_103001 [Melampsora larici-populina 98AG31]EGG10823.1 hypothetical protein MELLADRAFT_103001 [Melampsora larici-populina 98AG31]